MSETQKNTRLGRWMWVACAALAVAAFAAWYFLPVERWIETFVGFVKSLGVWGVVAFALAYIAVILLLGPASVMSIAAGVAFGLWGVLFVLVVGTIAGALAFLGARYIARERVVEALEGHPNFQAVGKAIDAEGWKVVGLIRLSPPVPFAVTSYFFGVTNIGFWVYLLTTFVGIIPATLVWVNLGAMGHSFGTGGGNKYVQWALLAVGIVATVIAGTLVTRKARETLRAAGGTGEL
jgi:uncharacterized membrane protein YdjX (TVP38/TMEM64 family)